MVQHYKFLRINYVRKECRCCAKKQECIALDRKDDISEIGYNSILCNEIQNDEIENAGFQALCNMTCSGCYHGHIHDLNEDCKNICSEKSGAFCQICKDIDDASHEPIDKSHVHDKDTNQE